VTYSTYHGATTDSSVFRIGIRTKRHTRGTSCELVYWCLLRDHRDRRGYGWGWNRSCNRRGWGGGSRRVWNRRGHSGSLLKSAYKIRCERAVGGGVGDLLVENSMGDKPQLVFGGQVPGLLEGPVQSEQVGDIIARRERGDGGLYPRGA
jgi:hypothetical protein